MLDIGAGAALSAHGIPSRVVGYSEREASAAATLLARMEDAAVECAPIWGGNLEEFPSRAFHGKVDGIVAGFPCQPHSVAGSRAGRDDERNLLPAILRIARATGAWILLLENVAGLKREFDYVAGLLLQGGWDPEWGTLLAADVGASHRRDRWFCVALADGHRLPGSERLHKPRRRKASGPTDAAVTGASGGTVADRIRARLEGHRGDERDRAEPGWIEPDQARPTAPGGIPLFPTLGNSPGTRGDPDGADRPGQPAGGSGVLLADAHGPGLERTIFPPAEGEDSDQITAGGSHGLGDTAGLDGRAGSVQSAGRADHPDAGADLGHGDGRGRQAGPPPGMGREEPEGWAGHPDDGTGIPNFAPPPDSADWAAILHHHPFLAPALPISEVAMRQAWDRLLRRAEMATQPSVQCVADGMATYVDRALCFVASHNDMLRLVGNGVCPQQAAAAYTILLNR